MTDNATNINLVQDKADKLQTAIEHIIPYCTKDAKPTEFRQIAVALEGEGGKENDAADELVGVSLEGSTNYSYKIYLKNNPSVMLFVKIAFEYALWNPDRTHYDLARITTEYNMLEKFAKLVKMDGNDDKDNSTSTANNDSNKSNNNIHSPVATPYLCIDIPPQKHHQHNNDNKIRMIVAQWSSINEPWAFQYIDGTVDRRIIPKVAEFVATVNLQDFDDPDLNDGIKDTMRSLYDICKGLFRVWISQDDDQQKEQEQQSSPLPQKDDEQQQQQQQQSGEGQSQALPQPKKKDHFIEYAKQLGPERFDQIIDAMGEAYERRETLLHGDLHVFNLLVEPMSKDTTASKTEPITSDDGKEETKTTTTTTTSTATAQQFGERGAFYLCDWEMVHVGATGRDGGSFAAFPLVSSYFLAARGERDKALELVDCVLEFWNVYGTKLREMERAKRREQQKGGGNDDVDDKDLISLEDLRRAHLGWAGVYAFIANYVLGVQRGYMPFHLVSESVGKMVLSSVAMTGLECLEIGFLPDVRSEYTTVEQFDTWFKNRAMTQIELLYKQYKDNNQ